MKFIAYGRTDVGLKRHNNEDRFLVDPDLGLAVVCDGVGGGRAGEMAAATCVCVVHEMVGADLEYLRLLYRERELERIEGRLKSVIEKANAEVYRLSTSREAYHRMATTVVALLNVGRHVFIAHVGDSRAYLLREGQLYQLTVDHTYANQLSQAGVDLNTEKMDPRLGGMLVRAVGQEDQLAVDVQTWLVYGGDRFLLCSDGLYRYVDPESGLFDLLAREELDRLPSALVNRANQRGGADNVTAIVTSFEDDQPDQALTRSLRRFGRSRDHHGGRHISSWF